jgi:hypothetical protein
MTVGGAILQSFINMKLRSLRNAPGRVIARGPESRGSATNPNSAFGAM